VSENLVRDIHDAVAGSDIPAEASVRPPGTTSRELAAMHRDVMRKLRPEHSSVVEIGCGVALLGEPVARRAARYMGLDFAPQAVAAANRRFRDAGLAEKAVAVNVDVLALGATELRDLGRFERVLMYAVLHYARSEDEAVRFLRVVDALLASGGRALIGSLPLEDLQTDWPAPGDPEASRLARLAKSARWIATRGTAPVPLSRVWKARHLAQSAVRDRSREPRFASPQLPANYTLPLTTAAIERWLAGFGDDLRHRWLLPAPGVPLAAGRADLILVRR